MIIISMIHKIYGFVLTIVVPVCTGEVVRIAVDYSIIVTTNCVHFFTDFFVDSFLVS